MYYNPTKSIEYVMLLTKTKNYDHLITIGTPILFIKFANKRPKIQNSLF